MNEWRQRAENLKCFLSKYEMDLTTILKRLELRDGALAFVAGSTTEGIGNPESDIDIFVFTDEVQCITNAMVARHDWISGGDYHWWGREGERLKETFDFQKQTGIDVHVEYTSWDELHTLKEQIRKAFDQAVTTFDELPYDVLNFDVSLVDRILIGVPVFGDEDQFKNLVNEKDDLYCRYLQYRYLDPSWDEVKDIRGVYLDRDYYTAMTLSRELALRAWERLLRLTGCLRLSKRWLHRVSPKEGESAEKMISRLLFCGADTLEGAERTVVEALQSFDEARWRGIEYIEQRRLLPTNESMIEAASLAFGRRRSLNDGAQIETRWWKNFHTDRRRSIPSLEFVRRPAKEIAAF